jgi:hypothetical protein
MEALVEQAKEAFELFRRANYNEHSRGLLPFLKTSSFSRCYILDRIAKDIRVVVRMDFTRDEFELLENLNLSSLEEDAFRSHKTELILFLAKHYKLENNFCEVDENNIVASLTECLGDHKIATCYIEDARLEDMLEKNIIPCPLVENIDDVEYKNILEYYRDGLNDEEIFYWTGVDNANKFVSSIKLWSLITKSYTEDFAEKGNAYPMLFVFPQMLYASTRPKTNMALFQMPASKYYNYQEDVPEKRIAVTRYSTGMSQGLYFGERPSDVCGYFFYHEPESTTFLSYTTSFTAFNKVDACEKLSHEVDEDISRVIDRKLRLVLEYRDNAGSYLEEYTRGNYPLDLRFTAGEIEKLTEFEGYRREGEDIEIGPNRVYLGKILEMYAIEDDLDQVLCNAAASLGYNIVILTNMIGSHQIVTEVLDTRSDSYAYLWFKN